VTDEMLGRIIGITFIQLITTYPICRIYSRAGFRWYWGLFTLIPLVGFAMIPGALGFIKRPNTTNGNVKSTGQHTLYWVAAFSAIFLFGIPGGSSEEMQSLLTLSSLLYMSTGVASIYVNAGYSRWGGIMGLLAITNLVWPWILAFRKWPALEQLTDSLQENTNLSGNREKRIDTRSIQNISHTEGPNLNQRKDVPPPLPITTKRSMAIEESKTEIDLGFTSPEDNMIYENIAAELSGYRPRAEGTYLRAESEADGDPQKIRLLYTKYRKEQLFNND
jgi:hypothetical protein